jgi:Caspase domain
VILDACRNNPFARSFRNSTVGLAPMQAPAGTLLAYATAPGEVASDGAGENGLYTQHLLQNMRIPGLKIEDVFKNVRASVRQESAGRQTPWENTSLEGEFYFNINITVNVQAPQPGSAAPGLSRADIESAVSAALSKREQDEAGRRRAQQLEIERAVQAALRKREEELAAAQTGRQNQDAQAAQAAVARLKQELAELQAASKTQVATVPTRSKPLPPDSPAPPVQSAPGAPSAPAASVPPTQVALAAPATSSRLQTFTVGQPAPRPDISAGMRWRFQVSDMMSRTQRDTMIEVQSVTDSRIYTAGSQGTALQVWDRHWNLLRDGDVEHSSPYPALEFPLTPGKKWRNDTRYEVMSGTWRQQTEAHVVGWEKLKVPAGVFDVVKIELRGHWQHQHARFNTTGTIAETLYYAPQAGTFIKREIDRTSYGEPNAPNHAMRERWELAELP